MMDMFIILIMVIVSQVYIYMPNSQIMHFKYVQFKVCSSKEINIFKSCGMVRNLNIDYKFYDSK